MCGIAGFSGQFDISLLERMNIIMSHRGPDDSGIIFSAKEGIGLAHRRLSIIDLSPLGHQPMIDDETGVKIVFNGEIYNYREIRSDLNKDGFAFKGVSDTEVLLKLYLRDGCEMLSSLNGIFAFAIWDPRQSRLFLARDIMGVKPLYYAETEKGFLFASDIKSLMQSEAIEKTVDSLAVHCHLLYLWSPSPHTILKQVKKLEPGHALIVREGRIRRQWQFYDIPCSSPIIYAPFEELVRETDRLLEQAVRRQMVADVPVGAFLSGGLDSSSVVSYARKYSDRTLQCFTIGFTDGAMKDEGMPDDLPYARKVAKYLGVDLHTINVGPEMSDHFEEMIYYLDEPQADPAPLNVYFISKLARDNGIKVLLSGAGGDDIFTGYRRHYALMLEKYWRWLPLSCRKGLSMTSKFISPISTTGRRLAKAFHYADLNGDDRIASYFNWIDPKDIYPLYSAEFRMEFESTVSPNPLVEQLGRIPADLHPLNKMLYLEGKFFLADHNLNYTDKMSMAMGVEVRVPLLDPDLMSFAYTLPIEYKQRGCEGKWIFKKTMEKYLPHEVIYRRKTGFGVPVRRWLKHELRPVAEQLLSEKTLKDRGIFDPLAVRRFMDLNQNGKIDGSYVVLALMCIEMWCRIFIDRNGRHS